MPLTKQQETDFETLQRFIGAIGVPGAAGMALSRLRVALETKPSSASAELKKVLHEQCPLMSCPHNRREGHAQCDGLHALIDQIPDAPGSQPESLPEEVEELADRLLEEFLRAYVKGKKSSGIAWTGLARLVLADRKAAVEAEKEYYHGILSMAAARLGGTVEGRPTHTGNFLQRIDELRSLEAERAAMKANIADMVKAQEIRAAAIRGLETERTAMIARVEEAAKHALEFTKHVTAYEPERKGMQACISAIVAAAKGKGE